MSTTTQDTGTEGLVDQAKSELGDVASDVQDKAVELKDQGRGKLGETLDRRTTEVGGQARQAAQVLRQSSTQLASGGEGNTASRSLISRTWQPNRSSGSVAIWSGRAVTSCCAMPRTSRDAGRGWLRELAS